MISSHVGQLPRHLYVWVDTKFTHEEPSGFVPAVWFGLVSYPGRAWGCTVMLESGAIYRNLPAHAIAFDQEADSFWEPRRAQTWDCYGYEFTAHEYDYLRGLDCLVKLATGDELMGEYLFSVAPIGDGFGAYPEQAKEFTFIRLENNRLTIQPTNHIVFRERSFTGKYLAFPKGLKRQTEIWTAE